MRPIFTIAAANLSFHSVSLAANPLTSAAMAGSTRSWLSEKKSPMPRGSSL
uniref:Pox1 n=1 Tax=Arundo donax TaxID=35708 RepID=A0A0A9C9D6_ARUDO